MKCSSISSRSVLDFAVEVYVAHSVMARRNLSNKDYRTMQLDIDRVMYPLYSSLFSSISFPLLYLFGLVSFSNFWLIIGKAFGTQDLSLYPTCKAHVERSIQGYETPQYPQFY